MLSEIISNIFCILIMAVLCLSVTLQNMKKDKTGRRFSLLAHVIIAFSAVNIVCVFTEGNPKLRALSYIANLLSFLLVDGAIIAFSAYLATLVRQVGKKWEKIMNPAVFFTYIRIATVSALAAFGKLFSIDEAGRYQAGPLVFIPYVMSGLIMFMLLLVVLRNKSLLTKTQLFVMVAYLLVPIPAVAAELFFELYSLTTYALTLSVLMVYVLIQTNLIEVSLIRESVLEEISYKDLLTNLGNRRAYYDRFSKLKDRQPIGVVFCDINGLKYTNDHFGHNQGDQLIVRFAAILTQVFSAEDVFRISGDEFVAIVPDLSQEDFNRKADLCRETITAQGSIAAMGTAYGSGDGIDELVTAAEGLMYENKHDQYLRGVAIDSRRSAPGGAVPAE